MKRDTGLGRAAVGLATACVLVACAGAGPQGPVPSSGAGAASDCTDCFRDGETARSDGDPVRAMELFEHGCQRGEAAACHAAGSMYAAGAGVPENDPRAVELLVRACQLDHGQACADTGIPMINSDERAAEGRALLARGCEGGHAVSCTYLAGSHQQGLGGPVDHAAAARAFNRSCQLGHALGCTHYGIALQRGQGIAEDLPRARELYRRACAGGDPLGCGNFGVLQRDGLGGPTDMQGAALAFDRGCAAGGANACNGLGVAYYRGVGGLEASRERALELFELSCKGGDPVGCKNFEGVTRAETAKANAQGEQRWSTTIGSLTIGSGEETATFEDVRSTCNAIPLSLAFGAGAGEVRACLDDGAKRRVSLAVEGGRITSSSVEPGDAAGRCVVGALGRAPLGTLTCAFEASVSR